MPLEFRHSVKD